MELLAIASGKVPFASTAASHQPVQLQKAMLDIETLQEGIAKAKSVADVVQRVQNAHGKAKDILKTSALLTDAYFFYTPSQIWLSSLFVVDEPLALFYIGIKVLQIDLNTKLLVVLRKCADLLRSSILAKPGKSEMSELTRIDKKLYKCRNPEKIDLVSIHKIQKRDGEGKASEVLDEKVIKKRKLERENSMKEAEAIFGPSLAQK